ncbi:MAG: tripartite tricarboxylate transporter TctB family protein [Pseudomonadota bacterium]
MRFDDRWVGLTLVILGVLVFSVARTFPLMAGMPYGPGFFPSIAAIGLIVCGIVIAFGGYLRSRAALPSPGLRQTTAVLTWRGLGRPAVIGAIVVFFGLALPILGFHISAVITVGAAAFVFGAGPLTAVVLAISAAFAVHAAFYSMLRVPLPWGVLTPVAW